MLRETSEGYRAFEQLGDGKMSEEKYTCTICGKDGIRCFYPNSDELWRKQQESLPVEDAAFQEKIRAYCPVCSAIETNKEADRRKKRSEKDLLAIFSKAIEDWDNFYGFSPKIQKELFAMLLREKNIDFVQLMKGKVGKDE